MLTMHAEQIAKYVTARKKDLLKIRNVTSLS